MSVRLPWILVWQEIQAWRVFGSVFPPQVLRYATHHSLEDQSGCSRMVQNTWLRLNTEGALCM